MPKEPIEKYRDNIKTNERGSAHPETPEKHDQHLMSEEEMLDETIEESFPAGDPPGHVSKSLEDQKAHET